MAVASNTSAMPLPYSSWSLRMKTFFTPSRLAHLAADRALDVVGRDRAEVVHEADRTVDLRLAGRRAALLGEPGVGVGRRDLRHVGAVGDRDRDLGRAGVVGADVDDGERIGDRLVGVLGLDRAVPLARLRRGVVEVHDLEAVARRRRRRPRPRPGRRRSSCRCPRGASRPASATTCRSGACPWGIAWAATSPPATPSPNSTTATAAIRDTLMAAPPCSAL